MCVRSRQYLSGKLETEADANNIWPMNAHLSHTMWNDLLGVPNSPVYGLLPVGHVCVPQGLSVGGVRWPMVVCMCWMLRSGQSCRGPAPLLQRRALLNGALGRRSGGRWPPLHQRRAKVPEQICVSFVWRLERKKSCSPNFCLHRKFERIYGSTRWIRFVFIQMPRMIISFANFRQEWTIVFQKTIIWVQPKIIIL